MMDRVRSLVFLHGAIGLKNIKKDQVNVSVSIVDDCLNRIAENPLKNVADGGKKIFYDEDACYGESNFFVRYNLNKGR